MEAFAPRASIHATRVKSGECPAQQSGPMIIGLPSSRIKPEAN
jgi:hypothetical protein